MKGNKEMNKKNLKEMNKKNLKEKKINLVKIYIYIYI